MGVFDCQKTNEVRNPKRGGRLFEDGRLFRLAKLREAGFRAASADPKIKPEGERLAKTDLLPEQSRL